MQHFLSLNLRFSHIFFFASENDYDYLFYREILLNSGELISENMTGKNSLRFQDPIQTYTQQTDPPVPAPA